MKNISEILSLLRREKGLGQKEMSLTLHLSISAISSYENGVHNPDLAMLCKLADFYDVTTDYLLGRTEFRCPPETLNQYVTSDYTVQDIVNTVLSLDKERQTSVVNFVKHMKHLHDETKNKP